MILEKINNLKDIKKLSLKEKNILADEIRNTILNVVSKNGGHLASNLGVVELTIALLVTFNLPKDKIIWDVGHQCYPFKLLTGRLKNFDTLRKLNGIAGFPRSEESIYDLFDTGHSSTSISLGLGMARARDINKTNEKIISIIGDGALTGGLALEALNDAGVSKTNLIVILNDNTMSISKNTGGMSKLLLNLRTQRFYIKLNEKTRNIILKIPVIGKYLYKLISSIKRHIKGLFIKNMYFENIGFTYLGPIDGHDIHKLESIFKRASNIKGPILIHVLTKKGKGYSFAENNPSLYHAVGPFDLEKGVTVTKKMDYSNIMGEELVRLAKENKKIVAITAAMEEGCGLSLFKKKYPSRFFDVEIAEEHAITMAAGLARGGMIPVVPIYSCFMQRAYDEIIHDVVLNNLHVVLLLDRSGITGNDGTTHQGILDLSYLNTIPNLTIMAPYNYSELRKMLQFAINYDGVIAIRYPKGSEKLLIQSHNKIVLGKSDVMLTGNDVTIVAIGKMVEKAYNVSIKLKKENINATVINLRFLKPLDINTINESFIKTGKIVTIEDNIITGLGSTIKNYFDTNKVLSLGYPEKFIEHGKIDEIEKAYHLDEDSIYEKIKDFIKK